MNNKDSMSKIVSPKLDIEIADSACLIAEQVYKANPKEPTNSRINTMSRIAVSIYLRQLKIQVVDIANYLGKHRTSVLHYVKTHPDRLKFDPEYRNMHFLFLKSIENER